MAQRRMIDDSMWANEKFAEMPMGARLLQIGLINHADDQGRVKANPAYLRAQVFPYDNMSTDDIQQWLNIMAHNGTIILYDVDNRQYAQLTNWWNYQRHQYAQPSEHPRPEGWKDRIRKTHTKGMIVTCNWYLRDNREPIPDTCDQDGKPLPPKRRTGKPPVDDTPVDTDEYSPDEADDTLHDSGEYSPESTPEDTRLRSSISIRSIEDKGEYTHAQGSGAADVSVPPSFGSIEYLPGLPDPRQRQGKRTEVAERFLEAKKLGITAEQYRLMVDALLVGFGKKAMVDAGNDKALHFAQELTLKMMRMSERFRSVDGIESIFASWYTDDWRGKRNERPNSDQLEEHASAMADGKFDAKVETKTASPIRFKQWCLDKFGTDIISTLNIPESVLRQQYEQATRIH